MCVRPGSQHLRLRRRHIGFLALDRDLKQGRIQFQQDLALFDLAIVVGVQLPNDARHLRAHRRGHQRLQSAGGADYLLDIAPGYGLGDPLGRGLLPDKQEIAAS